MKMNRITISIPQQQLTRLHAYCKAHGLRISEVLRRIIDAFFAQLDREDT